jgi:DNA-binding transcriptional ArsR family regulator
VLKRDPALDRVFHALADPTRRSIVDRLAHGAASVSDLARPLPMSLPAVLQHLQVLEHSGLVRTEKVGRVRTCTIEVAALQPAERWIHERRAGWQRRLDRLGTYLADPTGG